MFTSEQLQSFKAKIDTAKTIALFWHNNIDWDAVGSVLWLAWILQKLGKQVSCFTTIAPSTYFDFVAWIEKIRTDFDYTPYDLIIFLDFTWYGRIKAITQWHEDYFDNANIIVVDHHIDDPDSFVTHALKMKDVDASSNCELLLEICHELWPTLIDSTIATHWYMGFLTDTGSFQYQVDSKRTFSNASILIEYWADKNRLIHKLFNNSFTGLIDFMKLVTPRIHFSWNICSIRYTIDEVTSCKITPDEAGKIMHLIRGIGGVWVFAEIRLLGNTPERRCSLRSWYLWDTRLNVQKIASTFWWGGHMYAAGCSFAYNPDLVIEEQIAIISDQLNKEAQRQL